jgi:hypothetical protein
METAKSAHTSSVLPVLKVRVYAGGHASPQLPYFISAIECLDQIIHTSQLFSSKIVQYHYVNENRDLNWSPYDLVGWLKDSHIHFILTHPHQGSPQWNVSDVHAALQDLKSHAGYPSGSGLDCPVFLQHKYSYLLAVRQCILPTLAVQLPLAVKTTDPRGNTIYKTDVKASDFDTSELRSFLNINNEGNGWVVKHPFVTVHEGMKFCTTHDEIRERLAIVSSVFAGRLPYTMIQPKLSNRKEYKAIVLNGIASHILPQKANGISCPGLAFSSKKELFLFAESAVRCLKQNRPGSLVEGLMRVDIMQNCRGNMVVNEFESLEAIYESSDREAAEVMSGVQCFMFTHWINAIKRSFNELTICN